MDKEIVEGSVIIARFMGENVSTIGDVPKIKYGKYSRKPISEWAKYHVSWDALMPVVEKIKEYSAFRLTVGNIRSVAHFDEVPGNKSCEENTIAAVWKAVIQFIQWYNTQTKNS